MRSYTFVAATYPLRSLIAPLARWIIAARRKRILLVFGMSRSGTSMLTKFLALGPTAISMHEPEVELMKQRFGPQRPFTQQAFWDFVHSAPQREFKVHSLVCIAMLAALKAPASVHTIVIKPIALLDVMPQACKALPSAGVLYICRHPAGRSESILRQLQHDQDIESISLADLEQVGREWGGTNRQVQAWFQEHPAWRWVSFEPLTREPVPEFRQLYEQFGLAWNEAIQNEIQQKTSGGDGEYYAVQRDASKQADKWRKSLTGEQVQAIRRGCLPFGTNLYEGF
ncbi:MAG: sulfotransferase [Chloroflexi bacterium]|nr:sulfotransferase [Chloroflexota bacterium]